MAHILKMLLLAGLAVAGGMIPYATANAQTVPNAEFVANWTATGMPLACEAEETEGLRAYYAYLGIREARQEEVRAVRRLPGKACRHGAALYLALDDGRALKLFDEGDGPGAVYHFLEDLWPELGVFVIRRIAMNSDDIRTYFVETQDGRVVEVEGRPIPSPARTAAFIAKPMFGGFAVLHRDVNRIRLDDLDMQPAIDCGFDIVETPTPRWLGESTVDLADASPPGVKRRLVLQRSTDGKWQWKCYGGVSAADSDIHRLVWAFTINNIDVILIVPVLAGLILFSLQRMHAIDLSVTDILTFSFSFPSAVAYALCFGFRPGYWEVRVRFFETLLIAPHAIILFTLGIYYIVKRRIYPDISNTWKYTLCVMLVAILGHMWTRYFLWALTESVRSARPG